VTKAIDNVMTFVADWFVFCTIFNAIVWILLTATK
jgi:hypothetical protein